MVAFVGVRWDEGARDVLCCFCKFISEYGAGPRAVRENADGGKGLCRVLTVVSIVHKVWNLPCELFKSERKS